jgi:hypothetical protein
MLSCQLVLRRIQAVVVMLALLVAPLALYARGADEAMRDCNGMCCLPHAHTMALNMAMPATETHAPRAESAATAETECHHDTAGKASAHARTTAHATQSTTADHMDHTTSANASVAAMQCAIHCATHRAPHTGNFGLIVPIAPTKPSDIAAIRTTSARDRFALGSSEQSASGFLGSLFQPPRA